MSDTRGYSVSQTDSSVGSSPASGCPTICGVTPAHPIWYRYCVDGNGQVFVTSDESDFDTCLAVYSGPAAPTSFSQLTPVACSPDVGKGSALYIGITAGQAYYIVVDGAAGGSGNVTLQITVDQNNFEDAGSSSSSSSSSGYGLAFGTYSTFNA